MARPFVTVPRGLFRMQSADWNIDWRAQASGIATSGRRFVDIGRLPRWVGSPSLVLRRAEIGAWRAVMLAARGLTAVLRVPMIDAVIFEPEARAAVPFADGVLFDGGTGWDSRWQIACPAGATAGATEILVDETGAPQPVAVGQILSFEDWPFAVTSRTTEGALFRLSVEMPLRVAIPPGGLIDLEATGLFEMVEPSGNPAYGLNRIAQTSIPLQEWLR